MSLTGSCIPAVWDVLPWLYLAGNSTVGPIESTCITAVPVAIPDQYTGLMSTPLFQVEGLHAAADGNEILAGHRPGG